MWKPAAAKARMAIRSQSERTGKIAMKRTMLSLLAAATLLCARDDSLIAGSKGKLWKQSASCAAPMAAGCYGPVCSAPGCYGPGCFSPGCFAPSCSAPQFGCSGCAVPGCAMPFDAGWSAPQSFGGYPSGPVVGGVSMTPAYYAPMAPMQPTIPGIPPAEDIAW